MDREKRIEQSAVLPLLLIPPAKFPTVLSWARRIGHPACDVCKSKIDDELENTPRPRDRDPPCPVLALYAT